MKIDKFKLKVLGNGYQKKSYIHVKDVIEGIIYVVSKNKKTYDTFNISNNDSQTVRSIANQCVNNFQKKKIILNINIKLFMRNSCEGGMEMCP